MDLRNKVTSLDHIRGAMIFEFFSPGIPIILKNAGCEFIIFDMEHGGLSLEFEIIESVLNCSNDKPPCSISKIINSQPAFLSIIGIPGLKNSKIIAPRI